MEDREGHGLGYTVPQLEQALQEAVRARTTAESRAAEYLQQVADRDRFIQIDRSIIKQRDEEIGRLQQLLTKAASNGHVLMKHPPYGSSLLDCDLGPCTDYRAALKG